jgi:hypothetical protein
MAQATKTMAVTIIINRHKMNKTKIRQVTHRQDRIDMNNKALLLVAVVAATMLAAATIALQNSAYAKITSEDTSCTNGGGNEPGGQQPSCKGSGLTQNTENQNPAGHAPPGQN